MAIDLHSPLAEPHPRRLTFPRRHAVLIGLLLAAFLPRAGMAWRADVICEDGPVYIAAAKALEQGNFDLGFNLSNLGLNTYPVVLMQLHKLGLDWFLAGRLWGLLMSTLVVLPLFGWVRRQLDERVAIGACLLYAFHPTLIERSPEVLRCPTYWFLLSCTLYFLWRAVSEVRLWQFLAAGIGLTLTVHTRTEAWFLLSPWLLWSVWRFSSLKSARLTLAAGSVLGLAMIPLFLAAVNLTWLRERPQWESKLSERFAMLRNLYGGPSSASGSSNMPATVDTKPAETATSAAAASPATTHSADTPDPAAAQPAASGPAAAIDAQAAATGQIPPRSSRGWSRLSWNYLSKLLDAFNPLFGLLALLGLISQRRLLLRRDQRPTFYMCLLNLAAIALYLAKTHEVVGRYFFPVVLLSTAYAAMGLFAAIDAVVAISRAVETDTNPKRKRGLLMLSSLTLRVGIVDRQQVDPAPRRRLLLATALAIVAAVGISDALTNDFSSRRQRQEMGDWIQQRLGPQQLIVGSEPRSMTLAYYADGYYVGPQPLEEHPSGMELLCRRWSPALIVLCKSSSERRRLPWLADFQIEGPAAHNYSQVDPHDLPPTCQHVVVWLRNDLAQLPAINKRR